MADLITEIEETDGESTQYDGKMQPWQKGALIREGDFGLYADGECYALCGCTLKERLGRHGWGQRVLPELVAWSDALQFHNERAHYVQNYGYFTSVDHPSSSVGPGGSSDQRHHQLGDWEQVALVVVRSY
jgi:hypothetical protein